MPDADLAHGASRDRLWTAAVWLVAAAVTAGFLWILGDLLWHGAAELWPPTEALAFLTQPAANAGRAGGIGPILAATGWILAVCLAVSLPVGLGAAILLAELSAGSGLLGRAVRYSLDVLAGVPSIVFGLFGNAFFCVWLGLGFSILSGGLTLACMVLPILIRTTEEGFRTVPRGIRLAAAALAISRSRTIFQVLLPAAAPGLVVGVVLGFGRAIAETAALIFTSGYVDRMPESLLDSGRALSVHIYDLAINVPGGESHAYATALVLVAILVVTNTTASLLSDRWLRRRYQEV